MRLIDVHTELWKPTEFFETLVIHQCSIIPSVVPVIIATVNRRKEGTGATE